MWTTPLIFFALTGFLVALVGQFFRARSHKLGRSYRTSYLEMLVQVERLSQQINSIGLQLIAQNPLDSMKLDRYEATTRMFETLLEAIAKLPPFGNDLASIRSASYLLNESQKSLHQVYAPASAINPLSRSSAINLPSLQTKNQHFAFSCYFCSKPGTKEYGPLISVKVKIETKMQQVNACSVCEELLRKTKKVKVLFFVKDGKATHWSDIPEYRPSQDYWKLNQQDNSKVTGHPKLELVYSRADESKNDDKRV